MLSGESLTSTTLNVDDGSLSLGRLFYLATTALGLPEAAIKLVIGHTTFAAHQSHKNILDVPGY